MRRWHTSSQPVGQAGQERRPCQPPRTADDVPALVLEHAGQADLRQPPAIVDIEIYAKENKRPPRARKYRFCIDREPFAVELLSARNGVLIPNNGTACSHRLPVRTGAGRR